MVVEVVELEPGRPVADLAAVLEEQGGALVVLKWRPGNSTIVNLFLPDDGARQAGCRRIIEEWRTAASEIAARTSGHSWPLGPPGHRFGGIGPLRH